MPDRSNPSSVLWLLLATALSLSIGWGIRGNFGHEYGAMIPGALATMAGALLAGRGDWLSRMPAFGFFGALGWSFGGSISYMQVIAYTHSGHSSSVLYGFGCLFVIGFLWAAMGGAGAALPACLDRESLSEFLAPLTVVFLAWCLQDVVVRNFEPADSQFRHASWLYWYDTDWLAALVAIVAVALLAIVRRRLDVASSLILHMAAGWWVAFLLLVVALGWRMTPPRGDNWAGCVGMVGGMWLFLHRRGWRTVTACSLVAGFVGGFGFATATCLKLVEIRSGWQTNWHSILEQTYGLINGLGVGLAFVYLRRHAAPIEKMPSRAFQFYTVAFLLLIIPYLNLSKNPDVWVKSKAVPEVLYALSAAAWYNASWLALAAATLVLLWAHQRRRLALVPETPLGKGQLLYLAFLWFLVIGNFERALVSFAPQRLVTEGVIQINAVLCTVLVLLLSPRVFDPMRAPSRPESWALKRIAVAGIVGFVLTVGLESSIVRGLYGNQFAGQAALHVRFGPEATAHKDKPSPTQPHP